MESLNNSALLHELMEIYISLDFNNPDEVVSFIHKMITSENFIPKEVVGTIVMDLKRKGIVDYKEYEREHNYMDRYNTVIQYYSLNENKNELAGNILSRYMSSLEFYGKSNDFVKYLISIYKSRFIDNKEKANMQILKTIPSFNQFIKTHK